MASNTGPDGDHFRFTPSTMYRGWKEGEWKARRHGKFDLRVADPSKLALLSWPFNGQYYEPHVMDPCYGLDLNVRDTVYSSSNEAMRYIDIGEGQPTLRSAELNNDGLSRLRDLSTVPTGGTRVILLSQCRIYSTKGSTIQLEMTQIAWEDLLTALEIPPNVVEMLHENNGGAWQHVSHNRSGQRGSSESSPSAFHVCFKSSQFEVMYGRHNLHSRRSIVLIMGADLGWEIQRLMSQFNDLHNINLIHILLAAMSTWLQKLEQSRWSLDLAVLKLEQDTGNGRLGQSLEPLPPQQLSVLRNDIAGAQGYIRSVARHSTCMGELLKALRDATNRLDVLVGGDDQISTPQILDAIGQYQSQQKSQAAQAVDLSWRIDTQWSVLVALMSKHDSDVTISMAQAMRLDSVLMRKMAAVSVVFLPATFLATFFSMMFFKVGDSGELILSYHIWMYFTATALISLSIWLYFYKTHWRAIATHSLKDRQGKSSLESKEKIAV